MKRNESGGLTIGYVSVLFVFIILVFVSFSILSLKQSTSSLERVDKSISRLQDNYDADSRGMLKKMEIDVILQNSKTVEDAMMTVSSTMDDVNVLENSFEYTIIVSKRMQLNIQLEIDENDGKTDIQSWKYKVVNQEEYEQKGFNF